MNKKKLSRIESIKKSIEKNNKDGFVPIVTKNNILGAMQPIVSAYNTGNDPLSFCEGGQNDELNAGSFALTAGKLFAEPSTNAIPKDNDSIPGNGAIKWGIKNQLPAYIYKTAKGLPYTAQALEFQTNSSVGIRPQFIYRYATVINGIITEHSCDFHLAGKLLISEIRKIRQLIKEEQQDKSLSNYPDSLIAIQPSPVTPSDSLLSYRKKAEPYTPSIPLANIPDDELDSLNRELDDLIAEYRQWYQSDMEIREFEKNNDLAKLMNDLAQDDIALDLNFPLIGLQIGTKEQWSSNDWYPKIVKVSYSPAVISRFEKKDENGQIHYVYTNERWRYHSARQINTNSSTIAYPIIRWQNFHEDLNAFISQQRAKKGDSSKDWNCWYVVPNKHLSNEQEYYTFPAWWSIYPSLAFLYATTLMLDKSVARKNDIAWRRIIYVDRGYLEDLYAADENGQDKNRQKEIREELEQKVNNFLSNKANNGKTLMVDSTVSEDGKTLINSIRVEAIPETSQKSTEDEIHAISSVLFYAAGIDPRLVGAVPGKQNSSSGTQARELELLNQKKLAQRRERQKRFLLNIAAHNGWCTNHIDVIIKEQTLSTLDASKTGIVEMDA